MDITFRRLTEPDFPLLGRWLAAPHVARWWCHDSSAEAVARDFGPSARGEEPNEDLLALLSGEPLGLVQRSWVSDYEENLRDFASFVEVPEGAMTLDYLIGELGQTGRGLGPRMIEAALDDTWQRGARSVLVSVVAANRPSWRALEKAGLVRVAEGDLAPENPLDDPLHVIYRIDRPRSGSPSTAEPSSTDRS